MPYYNRRNILINISIHTNSNRIKYIQQLCPHRHTIQTQPYKLNPHGPKKYTFDSTLGRHVY